MPEKFLVHNILKSLKKFKFLGVLGFTVILTQNAYSAQYDIPLNLGETSEIELVEVSAPSESEELPANVVKYYNPNATDDIHYYEVRFKNPEKGTGPATKYFKWVQTTDGRIHLQETSNPAESSLTIHYDPDVPTDKASVEPGQTAGEITKEYIGKEINNAIDINGETEEINAKYTGNTLTVTQEDTHKYSGLIVQADTNVEFVNASYVGNQVSIDSNRSIYGTLLKTLSRIGNLVVEMVGNSVTTNTYLNGGLLEAPQSGSIDSLAGDFIGNSVTSDSASIDGGVIGNEGTVGIIKDSNFFKNIIYTVSGKASGGAIYNSAFRLVDGIVNSVFSGNAVISDNNTAQGGAIFNNKNGSITNSTFIDNYAKSDTGSAQGGAIYTDSDLTIYAKDNKTTEFTGNYIINNGVKENQAIYVGNNEAKLTLNASNGGKIILNDAITGERNFGTVLTGDDTGTIYLNNTITNSRVSAANTNISLINNAYEDHSFLSLASQESAKWGIDINYTQNLSDTITVGNNSSGTFLLNELNIIGGTPTTDTSIKIINDDNDSINLALSTGLIEHWSKRTETDPVEIAPEIDATTPWDRVYYTGVEYEITTEGLRLAKSAPTRNNYDSIEYYVEHEREILDSHKTGDTLRLVNTLDATPRNFTFESADNVYLSTDNAGQTAAGTMNILGVYNENSSKSSTINAGDYTLFELDGATLNLRNVNLITNNASDGALINATSGTTNIYGTDLSLTGTTGTNGIINNGTINLLATATANTGITGTGTLNIGNSYNFAGLDLTDGASIKQGRVTIAAGDVNNRRYINFDDNGTLEADSFNLGAYSEIHIKAPNLLSDITSPDGNIFLRDGTLSKNITLTNGPAVIEGNVDIDEDATVTTASIYMLDNATLTANADSLKGVIKQSTSWPSDTSTLTLNLTGGTLTKGITMDRDFTTNILGDVTFGATGNRTIYSTVNVGEGKSLTVNNLNVFDGNENTNPSQINNDGTLNLLGGGVWDSKNGVLISGTGDTNVLSGTVINHRTATQKNFYIAEGATYQTYTGQGFAVNTLVNDGTLNFRGGINTPLSTDHIASGEITGSGKIVFSNDENSKYSYVNGVKLKQDIVINKDVHVYLDPDDLGDTTAGDGTLTTNSNDTRLYMSGDLRKDVYGTGYLRIQGSSTVINNYADIYAIIDMSWDQNSPSTFITNADLLHNQVKLGSPAAKLNLTGGTLNYAVLGYSAGRINILSGTAEEPNVVTKNSSSGSSLTVQTNAILNNNGSIYGATHPDLTIRGTLNNNSSISIAKTNVYGLLDSTNGSISSPTFTIYNGGRAIVKADNLTAPATINAGGNLDLLDGEMKATINGAGTLNILGDVSNDTYRINPVVHIADTGTLTTDGTLLLNSANIANEGTLKVNNVFKNRVTGEGTTMANGALILTGNARIDGTFDLNDGTLSATDKRAYSLGTATGEGNIVVDIDAPSNAATSYILREDSDGIFNIDGGAVTTNGVSVENTVQILKKADGSTQNHTAYLTLSKTSETDADGTASYERREARTLEANAEADVYFDDTFGRGIQFGTVKGILSLATTDTFHDSLHYQIGEIVWDDDYSVQQEDLLRGWNETATAEHEKYFRFRTAEDVYRATASSGSSASGREMHIIGVADNETGKKSIIDYYNTVMRENEETGEMEEVDASYDGLGLSGVSMDISDVRFQRAGTYFINGTGTDIGATDDEGNRSGGIDNVDFADINHIAKEKTNQTFRTVAFEGNSNIARIVNTTFDNLNYSLENSDTVYSNPGLTTQLFYLNNSDLGLMDNVSFTNNNTAILNKSTGGTYSRIITLTNSIADTLSNINIANNTTTGNGTGSWVGILLNGADRVSRINTISNLTISDNTLTGGTVMEGIYINNPGTSIGSITNYTFSGNTVTTPSGDSYGIGIYMGNALDSSIDTISNYTYSDNTYSSATGNMYGAGIHLAANNHVGSVLNSTFYNNRLSATASNKASYAGAIYMNTSSVIDLIKDSIFQKNIATSGSSNLGAGGAISMHSSSIIKEINGSLFGSPLDEYDSTLYNQNRYGGAISIQSASKINLITNTVFGGNKALSVGGALYVNQANTRVDSIKDSVFHHNSAPDGAAIYVTASASIGNIENTKFIANTPTQNTANWNRGGVIQVNNGTIETVTGEDVDAPNIVYKADGTVNTERDYTQDFTSQFLNNSSKGNGAINVYNSNSNIGTIKNTLFQGNTSTAGAGSVIENSGNISSIDNSLFINNNMTVNGNTGGGAIRNGNNTGLINSITDSAFINNSAITTSNNGSSYYSIGGAINSSGGSIGTIENTLFSGNYVQTTRQNVYSAGGAVYGGIITNLKNNTFLDNFAESQTSAAYSRGGAIYLTAASVITNFENNRFEGNYASTKSNSGTNLTQGGALLAYGEITNGIINSIFKNNYVKGQKAKIFGGAIAWTSTSQTELSIIAKDDGLSEFTGNHREDTNGNYIDDQAIYISGADDKTLTLDANTGGHILMSDSIVADSAYTNEAVVLTGDETGKISLFGDITNANVTAEKVNIHTDNDTIHDYRFLSLASEPTAKYTIDVDFADQKKADRFMLDNDSHGTIYLDNINEITAATERTKVQVIDATNDSIRLNLNPENFHIVTDIIETLGDTTYNNETYNQEAGYALGTTKTFHDSLTGLVATALDPLNLIASSTNNLSRNFIFRDNSQYDLTTDLDNVAKGELNITGRAEGSVINTAGHSMFKVNNGSDSTTFNISNVDFTNQAEDTDLFTTNSATIINLNNVNTEGNFTNTGNVANLHININGNDNSVSSIRGIVTLGNVNINKGHFYFNPNTLADADTTANDAYLHLEDGNLDDYGFYSLVANADTDWSLDFDLTAKQADTITVNDSLTSNGTITLKYFNYLNGHEDLEPFTVKILNTDNDDLQLALADDINHFIIREINKIEDDRIKETTLFSDTYWHRNRQGRLWGELELATTDTTNDSVHVYTAENWDNFTTPVEMIDDTLKLINQADYDERYFESYDSNDVYNLTADMGQTAPGIFTINGTKDGDERSTINLANNNGFIIGEDTTFKVNNTRITGSEDVITAASGEANIQLNNADIDGNIRGNEHFNLTIRGEDTTSISGQVINSDVTLAKGKLLISSDTFADENTTLNAEAGSILMDNGETETYVFNNLISGDNTKYTIDLDLKALESDVIRAEGSGLITLEKFNILGMMEDIDINQVYRVQILKTSEDDLQLTLSETVMSQLDQDYNLGTNHIILNIDNIVPHTRWDDEYNKTEQDQTVWGHLGLATTETTNDSLLLYHLWMDEPVITTNLGDTLHLINYAQFDEDKTFTFDAADNVYQVKERLGDSAPGRLSVIGVADQDNNKSTINMQKLLGFDMPNETTIDISDVKITNASYRQGSIANITNSDAVLNLNNVEITNTKSSNAIANQGTVNMTGGKVELSSGISGSGTTNVTGADVFIADSINLVQETVNVTDGSLTMGKNGSIRADLNIGQDGTVTVGTNGIISDVDNDGNITFNTAGELEQNISGSGTTHTTADIVASGIIDNNVDVVSGNLTASASNLKQNINVNDGATALLNGTLDKEVTGEGTTIVNETINLAGGAGTEGTFDLNSGDISTQDQEINDYSFGKMVGTGDFSIDVEASNKTADKFIVGADSEGLINIVDMDVSNPDDLRDGFKVQILDTNGGEDISLKLSDEAKAVKYKVGRTSKDETDEVQAITAYDDLYHNYVRGGDLNGTMVEATTDTTNDSIALVQDDSLTKWDETRTITGSKGDTLALWNQLETDEDKEFNFASAENEYVATDNVGKTKGENVAINGVSATDDETTKSTLDLNGKTGFELDDATALSVNDVKLTGSDTLITVNNEDATIALNNAYIDGDIKGTENFDLTIEGDRQTTIDGTITNADAELKAGSLVFNTDTFAATSDTLTATAGNIILANDTAEDYVINELTSDSDVKYSLDIDFVNPDVDTIATTHGEGTVFIDSLNILNQGATVDKDFIVQVLKVEDGDLQLALNDAITNVDYDLGRTSRDETDEVKAVTAYNDLYHNYVRGGTLIGNLITGTTDTENDSIKMFQDDTKTIWDENNTETGLKGDTLALWNQLETDEDKEFNFDDPDNIYTAEDDLGETNGNNSINGKKEDDQTSSIDMNDHSGFEITDDDTSLNIENVSISNASGEEGSVIHAEADDAEITLTNVDLIDNTATGEHGGAIYSDSDVTINAEDYDVTIKGNTTANDDEAIYMGEDTTLTINTTESGTITIADKINGEDGYTVELTGDNSGEIILDNQIDNALIHMSDTTVSLTNDDHFLNSDMIAYSGTLNLINDKSQTQQAQLLDIKGAINVNVDADLKNITMDKLPKNATISENGYIHVDKINLLSDSTEREVAIPFAWKQLKDQTDYIGPQNLSKDTQVTKAFAPVYQYNVFYENREDMGYFVFRNTMMFNPSVLASSVASQAGSYTAMTRTLDYSFEHADFYMNRTQSAKLPIRSANNTFTPNKLSQEAIWAQPYGGKEDLNLSHGPKVDIRSHGIIAGADSNVKELSKNWSTATTIYAGFNGTHQKYDNVKIQQSGGVIGATQSFYNHDFYTAITAAAGFNRNRAETSLGNEYFNSYMAGVASKTGYNIELKNGKYIIQPSLQLAYSQIATPGYTNRAKAKISSDKLQTWTLNPNIKFIANQPEYQPYMSVGYVHSFANKTGFKANNIRLPEMHTKPYWEYTLGFQKTWHEGVYGFIEGTIMTGGRKGADITLGIRGNF